MFSGVSFKCSSSLFSFSILKVHLCRAVCPESFLHQRQFPDGRADLAKNDRKGIEKYNAVFFDTPEGEKSLVKVVTDVLEYTLEIPRPLRIVLRSFRIDGANLPVYSLNDHFFALCDGTDGKVSMLDGFYEAEITDDIFESDYIYMEGHLDDELKVTMKEGQPAWAEWTGENTAVDQNGTKHKRIDDIWQEVEEIPEARPEVNKGKAA